jgi:hypothetical protein
VTTSRRTLAQTATLVLVAVLGVSACTSDPSPRRIAEDLIKTETQDFPEIQECMLGVLDDYDVNTLGDEANSDDRATASAANEELGAFEDDLAACDPEGVTRTGSPTAEP